MKTILPSKDTFFLSEQKTANLKLRKLRNLRYNRFCMDIFILFGCNFPVFHSFLKPLLRHKVRKVNFVASIFGAVLPNKTKCLGVKQVLFLFFKGHAYKKVLYHNKRTRSSASKV